MDGLSFVLCVLSCRGLCDGLITRPEESYRLWCVLVCDLGTCRLRRLKLVRVVMGWGGGGGRRKVERSQQVT
jgi:hypothetical protein